MQKRLTAAAGFVLALGLTHEAWSQGLYYYPAQGQNAQQQSRDQGECQGWASQQPGTYAGPPPGYSGPQGGEVVGGAARGAVLGVIGGAIGGDAGKGAAIGAGVGGALGLMRRGQSNRRQRQANDAYQQQQAYAQQAFNRAMQACMQAKGYTVS